MLHAPPCRELPLLPGRFGPRPRTTSSLPFRQIDQFPAAEMSQRLVEACRGIPQVSLRESRMAAPGTIALSIADEFASGPALAFIDGAEFCHLHPLPHGSMHLTLRPQEVEGIVALGWAERHPAHHLGILKSLVLVYAPRTREELEIAVSLIDHSWRFARGFAGREAPVSRTAMQML